jgi:hypothetical protein
MIKDLKNSSILVKLLFMLSIIFIVLGIVLIVLSFRREVLDNDYIVSEVTDYNATKGSLARGQIKVIKNIEYVKDGRYMITYKNYFNSENTEVFSPKSTFSIVDMFGDGYILEEDNININGKVFAINNRADLDDQPIVSYYNNTLDIKFPDTFAKINNTITVYVKLTDHTISKKHYVSKESYFAFTPSASNSYYEKKSAQSYIIEGSAYIKLDKK